VSGGVNADVAVDYNEVEGALVWCSSCGKWKLRRLTSVVPASASCLHPS